MLRKEIPNGELPIMNPITLGNIEFGHMGKLSGTDVSPVDTCDHCGMPRSCYIRRDKLACLLSAHILPSPANHVHDMCRHQEIVKWDGSQLLDGAVVTALATGAGIRNTGPTVVPARIAAR